MNIAVLLGMNGKTITFDEKGTIIVYSRVNEVWTIIKEIAYLGSKYNERSILENDINSVADRIKPCRIIAVLDISEEAFSILENMSFSIWKVSETPIDFLDFIYEEEKRIQTINNVHKNVPKPQRISGSDDYFVDLKTVMENNERVTSKQVLKPFLNNIRFNRLEVICSHFPPWLNTELKLRKLQADVETLSSKEIKLIIYHQ